MKKKLLPFALLCVFLFQNCNLLRKTEKVNIVCINTDEGEMQFVLHNETPIHRDNFIHLINSKFYDSTTFHRIINRFMIQGGDPYSKDSMNHKVGQGGPGYTLEAEIKPEFIHLKGALCAARKGDQVNPEKRSSGSQFYIVQGTKNQKRLNPNFNYTEEQRNDYKKIGGTPWLDGEYTVFGQLIKGEDVLDKIAKSPKNSFPKMMVTIKKVSKNKI